MSSGRQMEPDVFRLFADRSPDVIWLIDPAGQMVDHVSPSHDAVWGASGAVATWTGGVHPNDVGPALDLIARARDGVQSTGDYRLVGPEDEIRWVRSTCFPLAGGRIAAVSRDVTHEHALAEQGLTLRDELRRRIVDTLVAAREIVRRTIDAGESIGELALHLQGRLDALARVQVALLDAEAGLDLQNLVENELLAWAARIGETTFTGGPPVQIAPSAATTLSLVVHELAANSVKYGVLGGGGGRVEISWRMTERDGEPWLLFGWIERGLTRGPSPPGSDGFGMELFRHVLPYELDAEVEPRLTPDGLHFTMQVPERAYTSV